MQPKFEIPVLAAFLPYGKNDIESSFLNNRLQQLEIIRDFTEKGKKIWDEIDEPGQQRINDGIYALVEQPQISDEDIQRLISIDGTSGLIIDFVAKTKDSMDYYLAIAHIMKISPFKSISKKLQDALLEVIDGFSVILGMAETLTSHISKFPPSVKRSLIVKITALSNLIVNNKKIFDEVEKVHPDYSLTFKKANALLTDLNALRGLIQPEEKNDTLLQYCVEAVVIDVLKPNNEINDATDSSEIIIIDKPNGNPNKNVEIKEADKNNSNAKKRKVKNTCSKSRTKKPKAVSDNNSADSAITRVASTNFAGNLPAARDAQPFFTNMQAPFLPQFAINSTGMGAMMPFCPSYSWGMPMSWPPFTMNPTSIDAMPFSLPYAWGMPMGSWPNTNVRSAYPSPQPPSAMPTNLPLALFSQFIQAMPSEESAKIRAVVEKSPYRLLNDYLLKEMHKDTYDAYLNFIVSNAFSVGGEVLPYLKTVLSASKYQDCAKILNENTLENSSSLSTPAVTAPVSSTPITPATFQGAFFANAATNNIFNNNDTVSTNTFNPVCKK